MRSLFSVNAQNLAAVGAVASATALFNGYCCAQTIVAADYATNAAYAAGWSAGQNGGYGFTAWNFDGTSGGAPIEQGMTFDHSSPSDALGTAWTLFNPPGPSPNPGYGWLSEAGRGFAALQPYQTLEVVIDNPTNVFYGNGYTIEIDSGTDNNYSGSTTVQQIAAYTYAFDYFNGTNYALYTGWLVGDSNGNTRTGVDVTNTALAGVKMDFIILPGGNYQFTLTPLNNPASAYTQVGSLKNSSEPTDWMDFSFYNNPTTNSNAADEFYISSMTVANPTLNIQLVGTNAVLTWLNVSGYLSNDNLQLESSANLGPGAVWKAVTNSPVVVNGQNVVTNPVAGVQQFYQLYYP